MPLSQWQNVWRCTTCQVYDWSGPVAYPPQKSVGVTADAASVAWRTGLCDLKQQCMNVIMLYASESVAQCVALYDMSSV